VVRLSVSVVIVGEVGYDQIGSGLVGREVRDIRQRARLIVPKSHSPGKISPKAYVEAMGAREVRGEVGVAVVEESQIAIRPVYVQCYRYPALIDLESLVRAVEIGEKSVVGAPRVGIAPSGQDSRAIVELRHAVVSSGIVGESACEISSYPDRAVLRRVEGGGVELVTLRAGIV